MTGQVEVLPGRHVVAVESGAIVLVAHRAGTPVTPVSPAWRHARAVLDLVRRAAAEPEYAGRAFAQLVTAWLMGLEDEAGAEFGVLTPVAAGVAVFLHGGVSAVLGAEEHTEILRGRDAGFAVDRVVTPAPPVGIGLFVDEPGARAENLPMRGVFGLTGGTVPGRAAVLWEGGGRAHGTVPEVPEIGKLVAVEPDPAQVRSGRAAAGGEPPSGDVPGEPDPEETIVPVAGRLPAPGGGAGDRVLCARRHPNDPRAPVCAVCGAPLGAPRPPLGLLLLDDGRSFVLDGDLVLGREPEYHDAVTGRGARPIRLDDPSGGMSRAHAEIRLVGGDVVVVDGGSTNGTHLRAAGQREWARVAPGRPVPLAPGTQVLLGGRVLTFDARP